MCLPAAEEKKELKDVLNSSQLDIVDTPQGEPQYEVKFKAVEVYQNICNWFSNLWPHDKDNASSTSSASQSTPGSLPSKVY
jgi:hypothetical protein